ncbi:MAG: hypothetical protein ABJG88_12170 [Litorimonas sp.]
MPKAETPKKLTKDERLAEQLRANLKRRKAATRKQKSQSELNRRLEQKNTPSSP